MCGDLDARNKLTQMHGFFVQCGLVQIAAIMYSAGNPGLKAGEQAVAARCRIFWHLLGVGTQLVARRTGVEAMPQTGMNAAGASRERTAPHAPWVVRWVHKYKHVTGENHD